MTQPSTTPELLAPAGTIEAGLTALDAGADAVYAGLSKFNARERGKNFDLEALSKLIGEAHRRSKRVYVTLNTLLKDDELDQVADLLVDLAVLRPDAIIAQDLGLVRLIREHFSPELEVHASTQMGFHNSVGLEVAARLGVQRVILERQVTFQEIEAMSKGGAVELEVFIHGALCCSRSGSCLFSSWMGGWSGNRGKCKQPCRRRYHGTDGNGFFFSPGDLASLEEVKTLKRLGVAGLKIEGRLRRPDYVRRVVTAYRMMLDAPDKEYDALLGEAKNVLAGALGRRWHQPFRTTKDFRGAIRHRSLGASGLLTGKVLTVGRGGFDVELSKSLHRWDTIRVQPKSGDEGPPMTVAQLQVGGRDVKSARKGQRCWLACRSEIRIEPGSLLFKTGSATADLADRVAELPPARAVVDLAIVVEAQRVRVTLGDKTWEQAVDLPPAKNRPLAADEVAEQFRKSRSDRLAVGQVSVSLAGQYFFHKKALKALRRDFWEWAEKTVNQRSIRTHWVRRREAVRVARRCLPSPPVRRSERVVYVGGTANHPIRGTSTARGVDAALMKRADEVVLPDFCPQRELKALSEKIGQLVAKGRRRFRVTSLYGFELLREYEGLEVTASFPIPVCNDLAVVELLELGARKVGAWVELERGVIDALVRRWGGTIEVLVYGRLPILTTRLEIPAEGHVKDGRGQGFRLARVAESTNLYPDRVFSIEPPQGASTFIDLTHARLGERDTSDFNDRRELV